MAPFGSSPSLARHAKRALDVAGAATGLVVLSPVIGAAALAVRATMGTPVLFRQVRPGLGAEPFDLVKFRTMTPKAPQEDWADSDAARLTPLGALLRKTSIDELPTLWNVLRGDMSLVGPRPLLMEYLCRYSPRQARRHEVPPGITGWAQVHGRNATTWTKRLDLDVWYVDHWSLGLDLRVLAKTVLVVFRRDGISAQGHVTMPQFRGEASP